MEKPPDLDRRTFIGALVLAQLAPGWQQRSVGETVAEARSRLAWCALDITDTFLRLAEAPPSPSLGVHVNNPDVPF
jgi:hypothetical protein